jgi:hypothetical protein
LGGGVQHLVTARLKARDIHAARCLFDEMQQYRRFRRTEERGFMLGTLWSPGVHGAGRDGMSVCKCGVSRG